MQNAPYVVSIIVNYNGYSHNGPCLDSLLRECANQSIVFVDNASTDGSLEAVRALNDNRIHCIALANNYLFAYACNRGMEFARTINAKYILLINNDTVIEEGAFQTLLHFLQTHPSIAGVQPLLVSMDNPKQMASAGCRVSRMGGAWDQDCGKSVEASGLSEPFPVPGITAGAALWRAEALRHIGLFDEDFGMYFEDVDLSLRARKLGYELYTVPKARVRHAVSATTNQAPAGFCVRHCQTNALRLLLKHWPQNWLWKDCFFWLVTSMGALLANLFSKNWSTAKAIGTGIFHGLTLLPRGVFFRLRNPLPENDALMAWIDRDKPYPPPPES